MHPAAESNSDICISDSIAPSKSYIYNIGQDDLRWLHIFTDKVITDVIGFSLPGAYGSAVKLIGADVT